MFISKRHLNVQSGQVLPLLITPERDDSSLEGWIKNNKEEFDNDLVTHGGILFRGFGIDSAEKFKVCINCFNTEPLPYMFRSSPRMELDASIKNIYLSTSYPNNRLIRMHNEASYNRIWGRKIVFCCLQPAAQGGETPIADSRRVLKDIDNSLVDKFKRLGVKYRRYLRPNVGMPWQEVFQTSDVNVAKEVCAKYRLEYKIEKNGEWILEWLKPVVVSHPVSGEETWFNHVFFFNKYSLCEEVGLSADDPSVDGFLTSDTFFGDGSKITYEQYTMIKNAYHKNTIAFPYEKGDVLFLDNMLAAHGRNPYKGDRIIATAILEASYEPGYSLAD